MEVDRIQFPHFFPTLLKRIASAHFVTLDFELSGIPSRRSRGSDAKQTLQERYSEIKLAVETFHVLQVGLTCVEKDVDSHGYVLRPFNFNVTQLVHRELDLERSFSYSSGAVEFLRSHGYSMESAFSKGIYYLRVGEEALVRKQIDDRLTKAIPELSIPQSDTETLSFARRVRDELDEWQTTGVPFSEFYNISGLEMTGGEYVMPLSAYQRRIIHQIVRADYPNLQTFGRGDFVQVQPRNEKGLENYKKSLSKRLYGALFHQTGLSWIARALAGQDISNIDLESLDPWIEDEGSYKREDFVQRINTLGRALRHTPRILVGHNCFMDLVFFFHTFYGDLPDSVGDFCEAFHKIFPIVFDTKYLVSANGSDSPLNMPTMRLEQVDAALKAKKWPQLDISRGENPLTAETRFHEAGFDSLVTGRVFLRAAGTLFMPSTSFEKEEYGILDRDTPKSVSENGSTRVTAGPISSRTRKMAKRTSARHSDATSIVHENKFESLRYTLEDADERTEHHVHGDTGALHTDDRSATSPGASSDDLMFLPTWNDGFWDMYRNKTQVNGTIEGLCNFTSPLEVAGDGHEFSENAKESTQWFGGFLQRLQGLAIV